MPCGESCVFIEVANPHSNCMLSFIHVCIRIMVNCLTSCTSVHNNAWYIFFLFPLCCILFVLILGMDV